MIARRAGELVAAMIAGSGVGGVGRLAAELARSPRPSAAADALVAATVVSAPPTSRRPWLVATALAGLVAAVLSGVALYRLDSFLPGEGSFFLLPLLGIPFGLMAMLAARSRRRAADRDRAEDETRRIARMLRAADVPERTALEVAAHMAGLDLSHAQKRFPLEQLDQHLAVAEVVATQAPLGGTWSTVIVGASVAWVILSFWASFFVRFGRAAGVGEW